MTRTDAGTARRTRAPARRPAAAAPAGPACIPTTLPDDPDEPGNP